MKRRYTPWQLTEDGFELQVRSGEWLAHSHVKCPVSAHKLPCWQMASNFCGHFALVEALLPDLQRQVHSQSSAA